MVGKQKKIVLGRWDIVDCRYNCFTKTQKLRAKDQTNHFIVAKSLLKEEILPGSQLTYKASTTTGDYHGQMNHNTVSNWMSVKVISNFLPLSLIMFRTAPKHSYGTQKSLFQLGQQRTSGGLVEAQCCFCRHDSKENNFVRTDPTEKVKTKISAEQNTCSLHMVM